MCSMAKNYTVSQNDWSLHHEGYEDQRRHKEKIKEAIKNKLPEIISEESIITSDGKQTVKIPIRSLNEYKIRYNYEKKKHVGTGDGDSNVGDIVGKVPTGDERDGQRTGEQVGDEPGIDYYETEIDITEVENTLFDELTLPNIEEKDKKQVTSSHIDFNDIRKQGLIGNIDKKRTILEALKRNAKAGSPQIAPIADEDRKS